MLTAPSGRPYYYETGSRVLFDILHTPIFDLAELVGRLSEFYQRLDIPIPKARLLDEGLIGFETGGRAQRYSKRALNRAHMQGYPIDAKNISMLGFPLHEQVGNLKIGRDDVRIMINTTPYSDQGFIMVPVFTDREEYTQHPDNLDPELIEYLLRYSSLPGSNTAFFMNGATCSIDRLHLHGMPTIYTTVNTPEPHELMLCRATKTYKPDVLADRVKIDENSSLRMFPYNDTQLALKAMRSLWASGIKSDLIITNGHIFLVPLNPAAKLSHGIPHLGGITPSGERLGFVNLFQIPDPTFHREIQAGLIGAMNSSVISVELFNEITGEQRTSTESFREP